MKLKFNFYQSVFELLDELPADELRHMHRVGILTGLLTQALLGHQSELLPQHALLFNKAAQYHDIGKIWVPPEILMKRGKLTEEEREIVQQHPIFAQMLLAQAKAGAISGIPEHLISLTMDCAAHHHEWWNGEGYPYGLKGRDIPLVARITAICDAYDAMTSDRVYRGAHSHEYACKELERNAGIQFDPALVGVFLESTINQTAVYG